MHRTGPGPLGAGLEVALYLWHSAPNQNPAPRRRPLVSLRKPKERAHQRCDGVELLRQTYDQCGGGITGGRIGSARITWNDEWASIERTDAATFNPSAD